MSSSGMVTDADSLCASDADELPTALMLPAILGSLLDDFRLLPVQKPATGTATVRSRSNLFAAGEHIGSPRLTAPRFSFLASG